MTPSCAACESFPWPSRTSAHFDHVHETDRVPRRVHTHSRVVTPGYAVGVSGSALGQTWLFFEAREPALVCGRAMRMANGVNGYGVYPAGQDRRFESRIGRDTLALTVVVGGGGIDRNDNEIEDFRRWVHKLNPASSHFPS